VRASALGFLDTYVQATASVKTTRAQYRSLRQRIFSHAVTDLVYAILGLVSNEYAASDLGVDSERVPELRSASLVLNTCFSALCPCLGYYYCTILNPHLDVPKIQY